MADGSSASFGWIRWTAKVDRGAGATTSVCCRATDVQGNTQPQVAAKQRGYLYNGWSRVDVRS